MRVTAFLLVAALLPACAARDNPSASARGGAAVNERFRDRVDPYIEIHETATDGLPALESTFGPAKIKATLVVDYMRNAILARPAAAGQRGGG